MSPSFLSPAETRTLEALCLALVPSIPPPAGGGDAAGLMARSGSDLDLARLVVGVLASEPPETRAKFRRLIAIFGSPAFGLFAAAQLKGFADLSPNQRER